MILVGLTPPRCFLLNIFTWGFFSESSWHPGGVPRRWWVCSSPFAVLAAVQGFGSNQVPLKSGDIKKMYRDLGYLVTYRQSRGQVCTYEHIYIYICAVKSLVGFAHPLDWRESQCDCLRWHYVLALGAANHTPLTHIYIYIYILQYTYLYIYIYTCKCIPKCDLCCFLQLCFETSKKMFAIFRGPKQWTPANVMGILAVIIAVVAACCLPLPVANFFIFGLAKSHEKFLYVYLVMMMIVAC